MDERLWLLLSLRLSGNASEVELRELEDLLEKYPEQASHVDIIERLWKSKEGRMSEDAVQAALNRHLLRMNSQLQFQELHSVEKIMPLTPEESIPEIGASRRRIWPFWASGVAAAMLILFLVYYIGNDNKLTDINSEDNTVVSTKPGSKTKIGLPDGTQVWLNADSKLTYNKNIADGNREVFLTGEAFFDVKGDKNHPFVINTSEVQILVLGTRFNVRSYENEKQTETSLISGSLEVQPLKRDGKKIRLEPNEKLVVHRLGEKKEDTEKKNLPVITIGKVHRQDKDSSITETLWVNNKLVFDGESLEMIAWKLERWYGVNVVITAENLKNTTYSGVFDDDDISRVMEALQMTGGFKYTINKKQVQIFE